MCVVNALGKYRKCFHMERDYDEAGNIKPDAKPHYIATETLNDVNKFVVFDATSFANLKAYVQLLKQK